jgi:hypothetical protein
MAKRSTPALYLRRLQVSAMAMPDNPLTGRPHTRLCTPPSRLRPNLFSGD